MASSTTSTEAVVESLMETLVDPLLASWGSSVPPSDDSQNSVAKQMHAIVLLYNYYHRKQKLELPSLNFVHFCKLAVSVRPTLTEFMKLVKENESVGLDVDDDQLSVIEKVIKNACNIAESLDASRNVPNIKGWPISKVVVLLIDSKKENCFLQFGSATLGVWSPIEKELNCSCISPEVPSEKKPGNKRKRNGQKAEFLQLALNAVRGITGIVSSDLQVLETHVTYSLSKEKSAVCFYMVQCPGSFSINNQVPLKFLVERLQGPLVENLSIGFWKTTPVVEYHHMLPYMDFISSWLSGSITCPSRDLSQNIVKGDNSLEEMCVFADSATESESRINLEASYRSCDDQLEEVLPSYPSRQLSGVGTADDYLVQKSSEKQDILGTIGKEKSKICDDILDAEGIGKALQPINMGNYTETCPNSKDISKTVNLNFGVYHLKGKNSTSSQNDAYVQEDEIQMQVDMVCISEPNQQCTGEKGSVGNVDVDVPYNQKLPAATGNDAKTKTNCTANVDGTECNITLEATKCDANVEVQCLPASVELQNALALLYRKRQEEYYRICNNGDMLALYEDYIERIRDGGDVGLGRKCTESIISGNSHFLLAQRNQVQENKAHHESEDNDGKLRQGKGTKSSEIYLPGKSSCEDLEYVCLKNNWRLPTYSVEPSNGEFASNVVIRGKDFKLCMKGGLECNPCVARESAAAIMMAKLRSSHG